MTIYAYISLTSEGEQRGVIEAGSEGEARLQLRNQGVRVLDLAEGRLYDGDLTSRFIQFLNELMPSKWMPVRNKDLVPFFRQCALMLRTGHTVLETLEACARLSEKVSLSETILRLSRAIENGSSLSAAMSLEKTVFNPFMVRMVEPGEASGELDMVISQLADDTERKIDLKRQLVTALTYPGIVVLASIGVVIFLITGVIPKFASFLEARGKEIPWAAADLLAIADFFSMYGLLMLGGMVAVVVGLFVFRTQDKGRYLTDLVVLKIPVIGKVILSSSVAQLAWTLSMLLNSGLSVMDSLIAAAAATKNRAFSVALESSAQRILAGERLSSALTNPAIPPMLQHMAAVGERSGELVSVMDQVAIYYRKDLDARVKLMTALIEPILILFVGGVVGFVYFAFFQALFTVGAG